MLTGQEIARDYENRNLVGWREYVQPGLAKAQFQLLSSQGLLQDFKLLGQTRPTAGRKMFLHKVTRAVLGKDTPNYPQQIGDCVSFGMKNANEYIQCSDMLMRGIREKFRYIFPPYHYGTGRVFIGGWKSYEDGSLGSWMAAAVQKYGCLVNDEKNVPQYSGDIAKKWGYSGPADEFVKIGKQHLIKSCAQIKTWDDFVAAIVNGYPCTTASDLGYSMEVASDGFHRQNTSWAHQMCFIGVDDNDKDPYAIMLNSWGDAHGRLKDFETGENLPVGVLRIRRKDVEKHIRAAETFAVSQYDGYPEQLLDKELFKLIGK